MSTSGPTSSPASRLGTPKTAASTTTRPTSVSVRAVASAGQLARHRVIVLGGSHEQAAAVRERIVIAGGQAAPNFTASVTHLVLLDGGETDFRYDREAALERLDPTLSDPSTTCCTASNSM